MQSVDPDAAVQVDLPMHKVRVETSRDRETVAAALKAAGYPPND